MWIRTVARFFAVTRCLNLRKPVDVGEAAFDVAAMFGRRTFVAEPRPELLLVIEGDDEVAADLLEEGGLLDALQQRYAIGFPGHAGIGNLVKVVGFLMEPGHAI